MSWKTFMIIFILLITHGILIMLLLKRRTNHIQIFNYSQVYENIQHTEALLKKIEEIRRGRGKIVSYKQFDYSQKSSFTGLKKPVNSTRKISIKSMNKNEFYLKYTLSKLGYIFLKIIPHYQYHRLIIRFIRA